jgi:hypothetical protein
VRAAAAKSILQLPPVLYQKRDFAWLMRGRSTHASLCVGAAEMHISTLLSLSDRIGSNAQLMEACRLSEITANISSCARPSARALCPTLGARAPRTWGNQIGNYFSFATDAM